MVLNSVQSHHSEYCLSTRFLEYLVGTLGSKFVLRLSFFEYCLIMLDEFPETFFYSSWEYHLSQFGFMHVIFRRYHRISENYSEY